MRISRLRTGFALFSTIGFCALLVACSGTDAGAPQPVSQAGSAATAASVPALATAPMEAIGTAAPAVAPTVVTAVATALPAITATTVATSVPMALPATQASAAPQPTATCSPGALTPAMMEGPYYKANPPEASTLSNPSNSGTKLTITGYVFDASCKPLSGARVDFWQADAAGQYDNSGYTLRGYVLTDSAGLYSVTAVVPGLYPGRTRHIHVKVTPPNGKTLTTQLFFPDEPANSRDSIFSARNVLAIRQAGDGEEATFNFVVGQ